MRAFAAFLKPIRQRLRELLRRPQQLTLVFDTGASSKENLARLDPDQDRFVTAVHPSYHRALPAEAADHLSEVMLPNGAVVRAWRTRRTAAGKGRDTVVVFSQLLYLRSVRCEVTKAEPGDTQVRVWCDLEEYRRLTTRYFGLRILITDRREWNTGQIIAACRGLSSVEAAFRNLKDPGMLATHPQFHWTDQKLHVHTFMCVTGYLLGRLLWWQARREAGFSRGTEEAGWNEKATPRQA